MPSFDTKLEADFVEVKNAVENTAKEIGTRFDFKGTSAAVELKDKEITLFGDADFQLQQVSTTPDRGLDFGSRLLLFNITLQAGKVTDFIAREAQDHVSLAEAADDGDNEFAWGEASDTTTDAWAAPWAIMGSMGWQASPSRVTRRSLQRGSGRRSCSAQI